MSSNTDDLGNAKVDLGNGSALFALPHDPDLAATSIQQDMGSHIGQKAGGNTVLKTPDPTADGDGQTINPHEDGGPLRRFTDVKSPLGMVGLESLAKDEDETAKAISARADEIYRNEFPVIVPKYGAKCEDCGAEYDDEDIEDCSECGNDSFYSPDPAERRELRDFFESVNKEGQSMRQLGKITDEDHSRLGTLCWVLRWTYVTGPSEVGPTSVDDSQQVISRNLDEIVRGDPKRIVPVVDANGRVGGVWYTCPIHRDEAVTNAGDYHDGHDSCPVCGCNLKEVHYVELEGAGGKDTEKYYFEHEIVMYAGHVPQAHGLDGLSPVHLIWLEQAILHWMDVYAAEFFNPHSERTPNKFLIVHTANPDSFENQLDEAKEEASQNPYKSGIFYNQLNPDQSANTEAQVIDVMGDEFLGQSEELRKRYENHIRTVFGVTDVFDSELEDSGGLNNEGLQLEVTDRSIAAAQQDYSDGPYDELLRYMGYDDWKVKFVPPRETDLEEQQQALEVLRRAAEIGLPARMENGEPVVGDGEAEAPTQGGPMDGGPMGGGPDHTTPGDDGGDDDDAGFFSDGRGQKQSSVPENAVSIDNPSEAPDDAEVIQGPRGGLYYVPTEGDGDDGGGEELSMDDLSEGDTVRIDATVVEANQEYDISDDVVEVKEIDEFDEFDMLHVEHPELGDVFFTPDEMDGIQSAEGDEPGGDGMAPTPDLLTEDQVADANATVESEMAERHGDDATEATGGGIGGAETITDTFDEWTASGYWDSHAEPLWDAAAAAGDGDAEIPDRVQGDNDFRGGTESVAEDTIQASREYADEELFGDNETITVYRGVTGDLGEQIQEAKENGEPVEVDPRALESWSMDEDYAGQFGAGPDGAVMKREISVDDVGLVPSVFEPELMEEQEITTVDNGTFEIPPDQIEV